MAHEFRSIEPSNAIRGSLTLRFTANSLYARMSHAAFLNVRATDLAAMALRRLVSNRFVVHNHEELALVPAFKKERRSFKHSSEMRLRNKEESKL